MASPNAMSQANTTFCLDLFKMLSGKDKTANVFFSPLSISSALAMVMLGARGNTQTQMSETLKTKDKGDVHGDFSRLLKELNQPSSQFALVVANRLYGEQTYQFLEDFKGQIKKHYTAEMETVDYISHHEAARLNINNWVENQTQGKIKELLFQGSVHNMTCLVLVNAIYFKSNWDELFQRRFTEDAQFKISESVSKPVKMMVMVSCFPFAVIPEVNSQVLEIPYKNKELSMLIFLPADIGLEKLEKELTYDNFVKWTDTLKTDQVRVCLPRFKVEENYHLKDVLVSMGMVDAFDQTLSDFSGMSSSDDLAISEVVHKAFLEVNEEGSEAAAATAVILCGCSGYIPPTFLADRPFLFFIRHNVTKSVLFAGRFCSPQ